MIPAMNVAIAGGTGAVGSALVDVFASQSKYKAIILSRKAPQSIRHLHLSVVQVDYSVDSLIRLLESCKIHTVICTFAINSTSLGVSQMNLIQAAEKSTATKRFIPSSFATPYPEDAISLLPPLKDYFSCLEALKKTSLEWAVVHNGTFLDYFAPPLLKTYVPRTCLVVDMEHNQAAIPGDGMMPISLTYTFDVARFTVAALDLERWPQAFNIIGDTITFNELVSLAEKARGCTFHVTYDSNEMLREGRITELPGHIALYEKFPKERLQAFLAIFELWMATGRGSLPAEAPLNAVFPDIKPLTAKELMKMW